MKKLLLFAGTSDGRELLKKLDQEKIKLTVSVATEYGKNLILRDNTNAVVLGGRLAVDEISQLMQSEHFDFVIDATHPYAVEITQNIKIAAEKNTIKYLRLLRTKSNNDGCIVVDSVQEAVSWLKDTHGNILITTGSKELDCFAELLDFGTRCFPRVLACVESIERCLKLGFSQGNIIAMQGPFSRQLNEALIEQFQIKYLVTKDGGAVGGFFEKTAAAKNCGTSVVLIKRPDEKGNSLEEILNSIKNS